MLLQLKMRLHPITLSSPRASSKEQTTRIKQTWPKWLRHFEHYRLVSGLQNKSNQEQVGTFLYAMGDCADDIVKMLSINETTTSFDEVKTALNGYFAARCNVIIEQARSN